MSYQKQFIFDDVIGDTYLARYGECIFWMGRYLERAENLARLLDVTHMFSPTSQGAQNWQSIISLHCDEQTFAMRYREVNATNAIQFYLTDDTHPNSILSSLHLARINASQLRAVLSTEMWVQINVMYNGLREIASRALEQRELTHILSEIRHQCQAHYGISEGGLYRDQGWYFYLLGKNIERTDQTTRLLDIKYHLLLPSLDDVGSDIDAGQWFSLLRAASAYHAFRRENPYIISPVTVAAFLLLDRRFPRSVACGLKAISDALFRLGNDYPLTPVEDILVFNEQLRQRLKHDNIERVISSGLHEYLDQIQLHLGELSSRIHRQFFG